jgi:LEA14-like dessication related protein
MIVLFLIISIVLALALWTRPPNVLVGDVETTTTGTQIQLLTNGVQFNLEIPFSVSNPNYFSVSFSSIKADIYYPIGNTLIGGGQENDVTFPSHSNQNFTFPFSIQYTTTMASSSQILADLLTKCDANSDITVDYDLTLGLRILFFTVSPTISNSASFLCPLTASELSDLASMAGNL